jgi:iron-sulfur cluster repair protein YtfE (RIC family)
MPKAASQTPHELLAEHRSLHETLGELESLSAAAPSVGEAPAWLQALGARFESLAPRLQQHFAHEERSGFFADVPAALPTATSATGHLLEEHGELLSRVQALRDEARLPISGVGSLQALAERTRGFIADLAHHEERENELLLEAVEGETAAQD